MDDSKRKLKAFNIVELPQVVLSKNKKAEAEIQHKL